MVYLKKPNSLMKISPIPIGAIYFRMKISNLYICIFKVPLLLTSYTSPGEKGEVSLFSSLE